MLFSRRSFVVAFFVRAPHLNQVKSINPQKDTQSKNADSLDGVFVVIHIESLVTAYDDSALAHVRLQDKEKKHRKTNKLHIGGISLFNCCTKIHCLQ